MPGAVLRFCVTQSLTLAIFYKDIAEMVRRNMQ
jgi:hypothetical protein